MPEDLGRPVCSACGKIVNKLKAKGMCNTCYQRAWTSAKAGKPAAAKAPAGHGTAAKHKEIQQQVGSLIQVVNQGFVVPTWPQDALSDAEVGLLARHAANEILQSKRLQKYLELVSTAGGVHGGMAAAVVCVALPRAVRHGLLPLEMAQPIFAVASMIAMNQVQMSETVEAEVAPARGSANGTVEPVSAEAA